MRRLALFVCLLLGGFLLPSEAPMAEGTRPKKPDVDRVVRLTTLYWPPYVHEDGSGASSDTVRRALTTVGYALQVEVLPWNRAIALADRTDAWAGVYPEYYAETADAERGEGRCVYSQPFGSSPVGFAHRRDGGFHWTGLADLSSFRIGVVDGYQNEQKFDAMVARGDIRVITAVDDAANLRKLVGGRVDAVVVDRRVMAHLLAEDPTLAGAEAVLTFHDRLLVEHGLHVCFEDTDRGRRLRDRFDVGLDASRGR